MIRITLYKNCILNDKYKNVFSKILYSSVQDSPFSSYLESLTHKTYEIDYIYQDDMTSLNFKLESSDYGNIYEYNYLKIESIDDTNNHVILIRYAFINSIKIGNEIAKVSYKIDIWHTYISSVSGINYSLLSGLRVIDGTNSLIIPDYYKLPVNYAGNDKLTLPSTYLYSKNSNCVIIAQIQFYLGEKLGDATSTYTKYVLIDRKGYNETSYITFNDVADVIEDLLSAAQVQKSYDGLAIAKYIDIGNLYILPSIYALTSKFGPTGPYQRFDFESGGIDITACYFRDLNEQTEDFTIPFTLWVFSLLNNFKRKSIGNFTTRLDVIPNGSAMSVEILCSLRKDSFKLFLNAQNKLLEITKDFYYEPLLNYLSGATIAQQRVSRDLQDNLSMISYITKGTNIMNKMGNEISNNKPTEDVFDLSGDIVHLGMNFAETYAKREALFAPVYNTSEIIKANNICILNARIVLFSSNIDSDNDNYVKASINNLGYTVYEYINDFSKLGINALPSTFINNGIYYNVIQLGYSDIYGSFPLEIAKVLNKILENGVKIWYYHNISYALEHDTYAVG